MRPLVNACHLPMRYPAHHKEETRRRLVREGGALLKRDGFAATGIDALMKALGMTGGAFYSHFPSKNAFLSAILERELDYTARLLDAADDVPLAERLSRLLERYMTLAHVEQPENGCVLPTLGAEIARAGEQPRQMVEAGMAEVHRRWSAILGDTDAAWGLITQCLGAILLARMLDSEAARREVLESSKRFWLATQAAAGADEAAQP